jgi:hypothetical protein
VAFVSKSRSWRPPWHRDCNKNDSEPRHDSCYRPRIASASKTACNGLQGGQYRCHSGGLLAHPNSAPHEPLSSGAALHARSWPEVARKAPGGRNRSGELVILRLDSAALDSTGLLVFAKAVSPDTTYHNGRLRADWASAPGSSNVLLRMELELPTLP